MALHGRLRTPPEPDSEPPTSEGDDVRAEAEPSRVPRYRIGFVAELTGVSRHALRAWERRYQALGPRRTPAGDRLYSDEDVDRVRLIRELSVHGHTISAIAHRPTPELEALKESAIQGRGGDGASSVEGILEAIERLDYSAADLALSRARADRDPLSAVREITGPVVRELGAKLERGEVNNAQVRLAIALIRGQLDTGFVPRPAKTLVCHPSSVGDELGTLYVALSAAARGWLTVHLSPGVPRETLDELLASTRADAIVVTGSNGSPNPVGSIGLRLFGCQSSGPALESTEDVDTWLSEGAPAR